MSLAYGCRGYDECSKDDEQGGWENGYYRGEGVREGQLIDVGGFCGHQRGKNKKVPCRWHIVKDPRPERPKGNAPIPSIEDMYAPPNQGRADRSQSSSTPIDIAGTSRGTTTKEHGKKGESSKQPKIITGSKRKAPTHDTSRETSQESSADLARRRKKTILQRESVETSRARGRESQSRDSMPPPGTHDPGS